MERIWKAGDVLEANFAMPPFLVEADPRVDGLRDCVAIQRGPIVYCLEEHDQEPGSQFAGCNDRHGCRDNQTASKLNCWAAW